MITRKVGNSITPVVELTKSDDGKYVLSSNSAIKNTSITFKLNEEFDEETADGRKVKSIITQDGNKLLHTQKSDKLETTIVREFEPEQIKMVTPCYAYTHYTTHTHARTHPRSKSPPPSQTRAPNVVIRVWVFKYKFRTPLISTVVSVRPITVL